MITVLKSGVRRTFIRLVGHFPFLGDVTAHILPRVPHSGVAARLYLWLGQAWAERAEYDSAIACFDAALARRPGLAFAHLRRGELHVRRGDWAQAVDDLRRPLDDSAAADAKLTARLREWLVRCHENLGQLLAFQGKPDEAIQHYDAAIALMPSRGVLYLRRGECLHALDRGDQALDDLLAATAYGLAGWELTAVFFALGRLLACEGLGEQGLAFCFCALALRDHMAREQRAGEPPVRRSARRKLDLTLLAKARDFLAQDAPHCGTGQCRLPATVLPVCIEDHHAARPRPPARSATLGSMKAALRSLGHRASLHLFRRFPRLAGVLNRVLRWAPHSGVAARLYLWLGEAKARAADPDGAMACFDRAIARGPGLAAAYLCRGELYTARGDWARAADELQIALDRITAEGAVHLLPRAREHLFRCHENMGRLMMWQGLPRAAMEQYTAALALRPDQPGLYVRRGESRHSAGRPELALDDYLTVLNSRPDGWELVGLFLALGRLLAHEGCFEQGVALYFAGRVLCGRMQNTQKVRWGMAGRSSQGTIDRTRLVPAHDALAEDMMNWFGAVDVARKIYRSKVDLQESLSGLDPLADFGVLVLPEDWARQIGHMGSIDTLVKMNRLGWRPWRRIFLLAPPERTANRHYLTYWDGLLTVHTDPVVCQALAPVAAAHAFRVANGVDLPGSDLLYFFESIGVVQQEWEAQGRGPLLSLTASDEQRGWKVLQDLGVPRDAWFVCLHARESGYHQAGDAKHQAHRNANILDYELAIREVTEHGGWVIRMGDPSMTPLPEMENVLDYAHSEAKSEWMDVFLCGRCRFFIGLASGLSQVGTTFGAPCVYVNWISNVLPPFSARDLYIPKLFWSERDARYLSFAEIYDPANLNLNCNNHLLLQHGLKAVDNTPTEIREAVLEMMERLGDSGACSDQDRWLQDRLHRVLEGHGHKGYCRMGTAFLRTHGRLLPEVPLALPCERAAA